jgi:hypothetical protein
MVGDSEVIQLGVGESVPRSRIAETDPTPPRPSSRAAFLLTRGRQKRASDK